MRSMRGTRGVQDLPGDVVLQDTFCRSRRDQPRLNQL